MTNIMEEFDEKASLYCPHCNKYQEVEDYELTGINGANGLSTNVSCTTCGGVLVVQ